MGYYRTFGLDEPVDPDFPYDPDFVDEGGMDEGEMVEGEMATDEVAKQYERYLKVRNNTEEDLTVYVQFRTADDEGKWLWVPGAPADTEDAVSFNVAAGDSIRLPVDDPYDGNLRASRIRLWAESEGGTAFTQYKEEDLWLVPEKDDQDRHYYFARRMGTFTYTFEVEDD